MSNVYERIIEVEQSIRNLEQLKMQKIKGDSNFILYANHNMVDSFNKSINTLLKGANASLSALQHIAMFDIRIAGETSVKGVQDTYKKELEKTKLLLAIQHVNNLRGELACY